MGSENMNNSLLWVLEGVQAMLEKGDRPKGCDLLRRLTDMLVFYRKYWNLSADWAYEELLRSLDDPADQLLAAAMDADGRGLKTAAVRFAETAAILGKMPHYRLVSASCLRKNGELEKVRALCRDFEPQQPGYHTAMSEIFECDVAERFWPQDYYDLLADIHRRRQPRVYLEIGVATGKSLALARAGTTALGVDPATAATESLVYHSPENSPQLYKETSDDFFADRDVAKEMGRPCFDVAFIDGLHLFDQVLRDFINVEKFAGPDSVILIHDCLPIDAQVATRERTTAFWTGDVWKVIPILLAVRPDLEIVTLPLPPSGVALIRRLDPSSRILERQYTALVQHFDTLEFPGKWEELCRMVNVLNDRTAFNLDTYLPTGGWR